ncbi:MAG: hypothetical protein QXX56_02275 [Candidatus Bathyarchaeia archaeon]
MQSIPVVWDLIRQFKHQCRLMGWWVSPYEDIVYAEGEYHNFLCARKVYPKTFKTIAFSNLYPVRENDVFYRLVNVSYTAWIFQERPPEDIFAIIAVDRDMRKHIAIYDLSEAYSKGPICMKINETKSIVFQEFEKFLKNEYYIELVNRLSQLPPEGVRQNEGVVLI